MSPSVKEWQKLPEWSQSSNVQKDSATFQLGIPCVALVPRVVELYVCSSTITMFLTYFNDKDSIILLPTVVLHILFVIKGIIFCKYTGKKYNTCFIVHNSQPQVSTLLFSSTCDTGTFHFTFIIYCDLYIMLVVNTP